MSAKNSSLAFDEAVKEIDREAFEPDLKVIVNEQFLRASFAKMASDDVVQVKGSMTVSF